MIKNLKRTYCFRGLDAFNENTSYNYSYIKVTDKLLISPIDNVLKNQRIINQNYLTLHDIDTSSFIYHLQHETKHFAHLFQYFTQILTSKMKL